MTPIYLVDVSAYRPPEEYKAPFATLLALRGASWVKAGEQVRNNHKASAFSRHF